MSGYTELAHSDDPEWTVWAGPVGDEVSVALTNGDATLRIEPNYNHLTVTIPPSLLDAIARVHAAKGFPHQRAAT